MIERIEINLLPAEYRIHTRRFNLQREIMYPLLLLTATVVVMGMWIFYLNNRISNHEKMIIETEKNIAKNKHILVEINNLKEQRKLVHQKILALERIDVNREKWIRLQEVFCQKLPEVSWIEKIEEKSDTSRVLEVMGKTYSFSEVAAYMSRLTESEFINSVDLVNIEQTGGREKIFKFIILCKVNPDARLRRLAEITE